MAVDPADRDFMNGKNPNGAEHRLLPFVLILQFIST